MKLKNSKSFSEVIPVKNKNGSPVIRIRSGWRFLILWQLLFLCGSLSVYSQSLVGWTNFTANVAGTALPYIGSGGLAIGWNKSNNGESTILYGTSTGASPRLDFGSFEEGYNIVNEMTLQMGRLGIGTVSPSEAFSIRSTAITAPVICLENAGVGTVKLGMDGGVFKIAAMDGGLGGATGSFNFNDARGLSVVASNGNVGIGTVSPAEILALRSSSPVISLENPYLATVKLGMDGGAFKIAAMEGGMGGATGSFSNNDTQGLSVLASNGNVGIGTVSPSEILAIRSNAPVISLETSNEAAVKLGMDGGAFKIAAMNGTMGGATGSFSNNDTQGLSVLASNGNVGIGTVSPNEMLEIKSTNPVMTFQNPNIGSVKLGMDGAVFKIAGMDGGKGGAAGSFNNNDTQGLFVDSNTGNVSVGAVSVLTSTNTNKLSVAGTIRSKEVIVESTNWPDYVFDTHYKLPSLAELSGYINTKGHLPGVPTANEISANGVTLGAMQEILLKKIEELTLYILDLNTRVDELKKENEVLREKR